MKNENKKPCTVKVGNGFKAARIIEENGAVTQVEFAADKRIAVVPTRRIRK
jgi:hypothetical protein